MQINPHHVLAKSFSTDRTDCVYQLSVRCECKEEFECKWLLRIQQLFVKNQVLVVILKTGNKYLDFDTQCCIPFTYISVIITA